MRTSILSRTVIAAATLASGSVALAAAPATAAAPNGITREMVLTAAAGVRADGTYDASDETDAALRALSSRACDLSGATDVTIYAWVVKTPGNVDALAVRTDITSGDLSHDCTFTAIASTDPTLRLSGSMVVTSYVFGSGGSRKDPASYDLSGDVFVSEAVSADGTVYAELEASGAAIGSTKVVKTYRVPNAATKSDRAIARKMHKTRVTNAKRAYVKALKKADTTSEKKAAGKAYRARKAHARAKYQQAVAGYKLATERSTRDVVRPFSVRVDAPLG